MAEPDITGAIDWRGEPVNADGPIDGSHWADGSDLWTYCDVAGETLPGIAAIKGLKKGQKVDDKGAKGKKGGTLTVSGPKNPDFTIELILVTAEHWAAWVTMRPKIEPDGTQKTPPALGVYHPILESAGVDAMIIEEIVGPEIQPNLTAKIEIKCKGCPLDNGNSGTGTGSLTPKGAKNGPRTVQDDEEEDWDKAWHAENPEVAGPPPPPPPDFYGVEPPPGGETFLWLIFSAKIVR